MVVVPDFVFFWRAKTITRFVLGQTLKFESEADSMRKIGTRDLVTVAAMMVLFFGITLVIGSVALAIPFVYLYMSAGIDGFLGATFYLVAANRLNKHGLLFVWAAVYGAIEGLLGYSFLFPYFLAVGAIAELSMLGRDSYRNPIRNRIGWTINCIGNFVGNAVPLWWSWESFRVMAMQSGFSSATLDMEYDMVMTPHLMLVGVLMTAVLTVAGVAFGQRLLQRHFEKAGVIK